MRIKQDGDLERCLDYRWHDFSCLRELVLADVKHSTDRETLLARLAPYAHRFKGHPERTAFDVEIARYSADPEDEISALRAAIADDKQNWGNYYSLGRLLKRQGEYGDAQEAWLSYPGFHDPEQLGRVDTSNYADSAAAMFYWAGQHELAKPLLTIAASSRTGAASSMSSAQRYALIEGNLDDASEWAAARTRRYNSAYGARDLMQLLHVTGRATSAWSVFEQLEATRPSTMMWSAALVGHQHQGTDLDDVVAWLTESPKRMKATVRSSENRANVIELAPRYLLLYAIADRLPADELAEKIGELTDKVVPLTYRHLTNQSAMDGEPKESGRVVRRGYLFPKDPNLPTPRIVHRYPDSEPVASRLEMLAAAFTAFEQNDFEGAYEGFNEASYLYLLDEFLPYFAWSAVAVNKDANLREALAAREVTHEEVRRAEEATTSQLGYRFDEDLAYAVLHAFDGEHDAALESLQQALDNRPYLNERVIFPMYQIVDLADRLYDQTNDQRYRRFALDLARRHTVVLPMYAWAYFVVAEHSESYSERVNAAASGFALDAGSRRGNALPEELIRTAREHLDANGAPYLNRGGERDLRGI